MLGRFSKRSDRLRAVGWLVLACGAVTAAIFYWMAVRSADPAVDDATALGYSRSMQHQVGMMMGHFGEMLTNWENALTTPAGEAAIIVVCAALLAAYFFRVAWVLDHDERRN